MAAYHPESARVARLASAGSHTAMGWFSLGGNLGFAAAPLHVAGVVGVVGLSAAPLLVVPAALGSVLCVLALRAVRGTGRAAAKNVRTVGRDDRASFVKLRLAVICRSLVFVGLSAFVALARLPTRTLPEPVPPEPDVPVPGITKSLGQHGS